MAISSDLLRILACPRHRSELSAESRELVCLAGCRYPIVNGIPVLLLDEMEQTIGIARESLQLARRGDCDDGLFVDSLGLSEEEKTGVRAAAAASVPGAIDPTVAYLVGATNGLAYKHLIGAIAEYPIPELRMGPAPGKVFLDLGCSWGRWCIAAARKGYRSIGIDPSLGAVMAARRVASELGIDAEFIVGDARYLPIKADSVDVLFSYSVLQHFSRKDVDLVLREAARVLVASGRSLIQMPTTLGLRCLFHQLRRGFREGRAFEVRYWSIPSLRGEFSRRIGPSSISVDCYFGIGLQRSDLRFMRGSAKLAVLLSDALRSLSERVRSLTWMADSVYVSSTKL